MNDELTYPEKAGAMARDARIVCCENAAKHYAAAREAAEGIGELKLDAFNNLRAAGIALNEASGREQLTFNLNGKGFVQKEIIPHLPEGMTLAIVQCCCHIANTVKEPVKNLDELRVVEHEMEPFFHAAFGETRRPREIHEAPVRNWFSTLVSKTADFETIFEEIKKQHPMEDWDADKIEEFLETTQPVEDERNHAKELLKGKKA